VKAYHGFSTNAASSPPVVRRHLRRFCPSSEKMGRHVRLEGT
jgi:hypothetical protein